MQNREEAEDITQEAYARALANFPSPDRPPSLGYLRTVALNLIRDRWRRQQVSGVQVPMEEGLLLYNAEPVELKTLVQEQMSKLAAEHRIVLQLRIIEGYSRAETAHRMGRSEDAVRGLQYRALQVLRGLMLENLEEEDHK
ncbi:MAG: RNA polymerase sigma factor [Bacillota bacterium]